MRYNVGVGETFDAELSRDCDFVVIEIKQIVRVISFRSLNICDVSLLDRDRPLVALSRIVLALTIFATRSKVHNSLFLGSHEGVVRSLILL